MTRPIARRAVLSASALLPLVSIVRPARAATSIRLGTMSGESETVFQAAADEAKLRGLDVKIIGFNDYVVPNAALDHGDIEANAFQHQPYLDDQIKSRGYHLVSVGFTYLAPIGVYSHRVHAIADLPTGRASACPTTPPMAGAACCCCRPWD